MISEDSRARLRVLLVGCEGFFGELEAVLPLADRELRDNGAVFCLAVYRGSQCELTLLETLTAAWTYQT